MLMYGQERVQIGWKRLIFPNASSMDIPEMPGTDDAGYAGFSDEVNNHYLKTFGTAALLSVISAGQMVGQMGAFGGGTGFSGPYGYGYTTPNQMALLSEMGGAAASQQLGQVAQSSLQRGMNIPPTSEIRPGYQFNVMVTNDLVLAGALPELTGAATEMEPNVERTTLIPNYLIVRIGGFLKQEIDAYVEYAREVGHRRIDPEEVARSMLWHFVETNEEFSAWRKTRMQERSQRVRQRSWKDEAQTKGQGFAAGAVAAHVAWQPQGIAGRIRRLFARQASARNRLQGGRDRDAEAFR